ncbi:MAG: hypothetical protein JNL70_13870 [Saprospiraceae bacterium]|nr:hypothetical protein [Saprospiraceae bacterium]
MDKLRTLLTGFITWFRDISLDKFAKKSNTLLLFAWRLSVALLIVWAVWKFRSLSENDVYVIKAFTVPPDMERQGYRGETVVAKVISEMLQIIYPKDSSTSRTSACRQNDKARLKTQLRIADGSERKDFDIKGLFDAGKTLFGIEDKLITGYIVNANAQMTMFIQMPDEPLRTVSISENAPLDSLFYQAALYLTRQTTPQYLVNYLIQKRQFDEAEALLAELDFKQTNLPEATDQDHIQTLSNWANLYLSKAIATNSVELFDYALEKAQELRQRYPKDIAGYAMEVSILMTKAGFTHLGYGYDNIPAIESLAKQAFQTAKEAERKENQLRSAYFDKKQVMGLMLCNAAYLANQCKLENPKVLEKHFQKSRAIMPQSVYIYNTLAYFYLKQENAEAAKRYITDALNANQLDGNICDSYAEVMLHFGDTTQFFRGLELALKNQKPLTKANVENYRNNRRWKGIQETVYKDQFKALFDKYAAMRQ